MNKYTDEEIKEFFSTMVKINNLMETKIEINKNTDNFVVVQISQMYEFVDVSFEKLTKISEFFGTTLIQDHRYSSRGCETCDYGSNYEVTLYIGERL
jgi:hypothetical protein